MILALLLSLVTTTIHAAEPMKPLSSEEGKVLRVD
jgi:hypothetical protein